LLLLFACASHPIQPPQTKSFTLNVGGAGRPEFIWAFPDFERKGGRGRRNLILELPDSYKCEERRGADFAVFYFRDKKSKSTFGVYDGNHPNKEAGPGTVQDRIPGKIGSIPTQWIEWKDKDRFRSEAFVPGLHIFTSSQTPELRAQLEKYFESARIVDTE
jgi:hypothetical protein